MPSPFPGMDPYLEGDLWTTVHSAFAVEIARQLTPRLRPRYFVLTNKRFVMDVPDSVAIATAAVYPDAAVVRSGPAASGGKAEAVASPPLRLATVMPSPVPHVSVEIRDANNRELVTAIEMLSPTNKRGDGRSEYLARRQHILLSTAHLLEIDLLRKGQRVPAAPYFVFLSRFETRPLTDVWPIALNQPLPTVPVPLLSGDPDVALDLQLAFTTIYDEFAYDVAIDYARPPDVPLEGEAAAWAAERIRAARG